MLRREFLIGAAATLVSPALASPLSPFQPDLWPPLNSRGDFIAWMQAHRGEDPVILGRRWDRYLEVLKFNDLWTPRRQARLPDDAARGVRHCREPRRAYEWPLSQHRLRRDDHPPARWGG
jgi:hypothetical protein